MDWSTPLRQALTASAVRRFLTYVALSLSVVVLLILAHLLSNAVSYDLLRERIVGPDGQAHLAQAARSPYNIPFEYCQFSGIALANAGRTGLVDAALPRQLHSGPGGPPHYWYCWNLTDGVPAGEAQTTVVKTRYWWGAKALYALSLSAVSVTDFHRLLPALTWVAWALLGAGALALGLRAFLIMLPIVLFGALTGGVREFADIANGLPFLYALLAAAGLALLMRFPGAARRLASYWHFVAGMLSAWVWLFDGHHLMLAALLALIGYLGWRRLGEPRPGRRALRGAALFAAGFVVCWSLGLAVKTATYETFYERVNASVDFDLERGRTLSKTSRSFRYHLGRTAEAAYGFTRPWVDSYRRWLNLNESVKPWGWLPPAGALAAVAAALLWSRRRSGLQRRDAVFILALLSLPAAQFLLPDDIPYRTARYWHLVLGCAERRWSPRWSRRRRTACFRTASAAG